MGVLSMQCRLAIALNRALNSLSELGTFEVPSVFRILSEPVYAASFCCMTQSS
jgi:hypothetical protein